MAFSAKNQTNPVVTEATGYGPYVRARTKRASEKPGATTADKRAQTIQDFWTQQNFLQDLEDYSQSHEKILFRNRWECSADKKSLYNRVQYELGKVTAKMDDDVERRRQRLAELLKSEEEMYLKESNPEEVDADTKDERMLSRYKELKLQKEMERQKVAEEKKEQQFRRNCDELRSQMSRKMLKETAEEGQQLLLEKKQQWEAQNREEDMFAEMWIKDSEAKKQKEEKEEKWKRKRDKEYGKYVTDQIQEKKLEKVKKLREKEEDAELMEETKRLNALEEEWEKEMKKRKQETMKQDLDACLRAKLKQKAKEVQEDLLQDIFFLKQIMEDEEEAKKNEKKRALMKEQKDYLKHLQDQMQRANEFERTVDKMYRDEMEKIWEKKQKEWEEEKSKRRELEQDVTKAIKDQVIANMERGRKAQSLNMQYAQKVLEEDEKDRKQELEKLRLIRERNVKHQKELLHQIKRKEEKLEEEKRFRDIELEAIRKAREKEESKIEALLSQMKIVNEHPYRTCRRELFNDCEEGCRDVQQSYKK